MNKITMPKVLLCVPILLLLSQAARADTATAQRGMVATVQPVATEAGLKAFHSGGNAVDAAVAAALMLGVVDSHNSGLGGGCFVLIRRPDKSLLAIDGRETAPAAARRDMFVRNGTAVPELSQTGPLAVGVPGALAAYELALKLAGRSELADHLRPAAEIAQSGFPIDRVTAANLRDKAKQLARFEGSKQVLLRADGQPWQEGQLLVQADLANTYRAIADHGIAWFYDGPFAQRIDEWMSANGGILTAEDFGNYRAIQRTPLVTTYRGLTIVGFPPPSSGGVHVAQILNTLEHFDLTLLHAEDRPTFAHVIAEAMKLAFADRAHWLGDADFADVPRGLIDKSYARKLAGRINPKNVAAVDGHGLPPNWQSDLFGKHTTHIAAADAEGNWVAITATINTTFGSKVIVPGTGLVLNNEMDDFSSQPGAPNAFGLIGNENNAIAPGKRPLSSMSPTIVLQDDEPLLTLGAAGGPKIITQVVLGIVRFVDVQLPLEDSVGQPRWHHQWRPDRLFLEASFPPPLSQALEARGHSIQFLDAAGVMQAITRMPDGTFQGVADPRVPGKAAGF